jgi:hypothetical protein
MQQWNGMTQNFIAQGFPKAVASQKALAQFSGQVARQAGVLSFENAFWLMGGLVAVLIPLPFIMRRPNRKEAKDTAGLH